VIVSSKIEADKIVINIQDFGIGIEDELVDKVYNRFFFSFHKAPGWYYPG
jgi:hypothetical protein